MVSLATQALLDDLQIQRFANEGYLVVDGFHSPARIGQIRDTFMSAMADGPVPGISQPREVLGPDDPLAKFPRMMHPHRHPDTAVGKMAMEFLLDARIGSMLRQLFKDEPIAAQTMFYFKPPGARGQDFHQDNFYLRVKPGTCIAAWLAVDDADEGNGGMVVIPGSNRLNLFCPGKADPTLFFSTEHVETPPRLSKTPVNMKAGGLLFFNGSLIHGSYPNHSADRFRRSLIAHYLPQSAIEVGTWYRPLLNFAGEEVQREIAAGSGPCGTEQAIKGPH